MDVQVQVAGQITSKPTATGGTKFDIPLSNGTKPSTFDAALATKISQYGAAVFTARLEQKGKYTNIIAAAGPGETLSPEIPAAGSPLGGAVSPSQAFNPGQATPIIPQAQNGSQGRGGYGMSPEDKVRVTKLSCISSAAAIFSGSGDVEATLIAARTIFNEVMQPQAAQAEQPAVVAADPQAVAAFVAQNAGQPAVQVGVEGVATEPQAAALPWSTT